MHTPSDLACGLPRQLAHRWLLSISAVVICLTGSLSVLAAPSGAFQLEEATIDDIHTAIKKGTTTCKAIVQGYIDRAKAYNGVCTQLVTQDGAVVPATKGYVRAGSPIVFPKRTRPASSFLPDLDKYAGPPLDFGRMETTASDPTVKQQFGMVAASEAVGAAMSAIPTTRNDLPDHPAAVPACW